MARQLLADWDNVEEAMRQLYPAAGKISVAAMPSFAANVLPEALKAFRDRYAGVNVTVHDVINEQVIEMVREGGGDGHRFRAIAQPQPVYPAGGGPLRGDRSPTIPWRRKSSSAGRSC